MSLIGKAEFTCYLLNAVIGRSQSCLQSLNLTAVNDILRRLTRNTSADLCQIASADIQRVGIMCHVAALEVILLHPGYKLIVKLTAPSLQSVSPGRPAVDVAVSLLYSFVGGKSFSQIDGESRREVIGIAMFGTVGKDTHIILYIVVQQSLTLPTANNDDGT